MHIPLHIKISFITQYFPSLICSSLMSLPICMFLLSLYNKWTQKHCGLEEVSLKTHHLILLVSFSQSVVIYFYTNHCYVYLFCLHFCYSHLQITLYLEMVIWYARSLCFLFFITEMFEQKIVSFPLDRIEDQWPSFLL